MSWYTCMTMQQNNIFNNKTYIRQSLPCYENYLLTVQCTQPTSDTAITVLNDIARNHADISWLYTWLYVLLMSYFLKLLSPN